MGCPAPTDSSALSSSVLDDPGGSALTVRSRNLRQEKRSWHGLKLAKLHRQCSQRYGDAPKASLMLMLTGTS